jgi:hypothetical protein
MLAAVLLHMVEPPLPVHAAIHCLAGNRRGQGVRDSPVVILFDVEYRNAVYRAEIARLPAGGRVEGRTVQN